MTMTPTLCPCRMTHGPTSTQTTRRPACGATALSCTSPPPTSSSSRKPCDLLPREKLSMPFAKSLACKILAKRSKLYKMTFRKSVAFGRHSSTNGCMAMAACGSEALLRRHHLQLKQRKMRACRARMLIVLAPHLRKKDREKGMMHVQLRMRTTSMLSGVVGSSRRRKLAA